MKIRDNLAISSALMAEVHRLLQESNPDPVFVRGSDDGILYANTAFAQLFHIEGNIEGTPVADALPADLVEQLNVGANADLSAEYTHRDDDGKVRHYQVRQRGIYGSGEAPSAWCIVLRDISDRVDAVRQVEALKQQAEAASLIKSRFLANMSHELRTPLNSIIGYSELLLEEDDIGQLHLDDIRRIRGAGADLLRLVDEVLDFSRLEASKSDVHVDTLRVADLVGDLRAVIEPLASRGGNRIEIDVKRAPEFVRTDSNKLEKILLALLNNACKFTHGGSIVLAVRDELRRGEPWVCFEVSDTGIGIPSAQLDTIFDAFRQVDDSSTRNYGGSGLGLNISLQLSRLLGGDIGVESTPGKGSRFVVSIPDRVDMADHESEQEIIDESEVGGKRQPRVLVIDDNPEAADLIGRHLERLGCRVSVAPDAVTGKEMAAKLRPDVITLALELSFIDGWTTLRHLKVDERTRDLPVIICSNLDERKRAYEQGVAGYVIKPVTASVLRSALEEVVCLT